MIVAISGWKRSGKDTLAQYLIENKGFIRTAFADPLKNMVAATYKIPREYCDDPQFKEAPLTQYPVCPKDDYSRNLSKFMLGEFRDGKGRMAHDCYIDASGAFIGLVGKMEPAQLYWTPRALCILEGSVKRTVTSNYWVQKAIYDITSSQSNPANPEVINFVISDLRYKNEVDQLRQAFGKELITIRVNRFDTCASTDASERDLDDAKFDYVIENKGSLEELYDKIKEITNGIKS